MCSKPTSLPSDGVAADPQLGADMDHDHRTCPAPLDCGDLAESFGIDKSAAIRLLATRTLTQIILQALAYAAYLNQLYSLDLDMDDILIGWQRGRGFDTR